MSAATNDNAFNGDGKADIALGWIGESAGLAVLRNTTGTAPPPTPSAPSLLSPSDGATVAQPVTLDWTEVTNAVSYQVKSTTRQKRRRCTFTLNANASVNANVQ